MPTVLIWKSCRFFFYSNEGAEPAHIHVRKDESELKLWLADLTLARNRGFSDQEVEAIKAHASAYRVRLLDAWRVHFGE